MREILFRGYYHFAGNILYPEEKMWVYGYYDFDGEMHLIKCGKTSYKIDHETIGQYTGLKDKNGKEIYEGDIVELYDLYNNSFGEIENEYTCKVEYSEEYAAFTFYDERQGVLVDIWDCVNPNVENGARVIGNIYENPELIGKEN